MNIPEYYPYRTVAVRDLCFRYLDDLAARQWPIASEERMIPTAFGATFVRVSGPPAAPALVLLHGAGGTSLMWAPNIEALSREYRTIAVDQIGEFGKSVCTEPVQSLQDLMAWLDELIRALEARERITLAGMSYGGALAAQYALHFPDRLDKLVLLAPGATVLRPPAEFWVRLIALGIRRERGLRSFFGWIFADMARMDPQWIDSTVELLSLNMRSIQRHKTPIPPPQCPKMSHSGKVFPGESKDAVKERLRNEASLDRIHCLHQHVGRIRARARGPKGRTAEGTSRRTL